MKNFTIYLDEEAVALVRPHLESKGLSFSGFLNQAVLAYADVLGLKLPAKVEELTVGQLQAITDRTIKGMKEKESRK